MKVINYTALKSYTNFHNVWGSLLNAIGGENFEKMQFDPSLQLDTKKYLFFSQLLLK